MVTEKFSVRYEIGGTRYSGLQESFGGVKEEARNGLMRNFLHILISGLFVAATFSITFAQHTGTKIDKLKTAEQVERFLNSIDKKRFALFFVDEEFDFRDASCNSFLRSLNARTWSRADFDGNGYTDLLVVGGYYRPDPVIIMNNGGGSFAVHEFSGYGCAIPVLHPSTPKPMVSFYFERPGKPISLVYKFSGFAEVNLKPTVAKIESISFKRYGCYGDCPIFELYVRSDAQATFVSIAHNKKKAGTYKAKVDPKALEDLKSLLNYVDFVNLEDSYSCCGTDQPGALLEITFDGGKVKTIRDYGLQSGPFGLRTAYKAFSDLRESQKWK